MQFYHARNLKSKFKEEFYVTKSLLETVEVIDEIKTMEQLDSAYDDLYNSLVFKFVGTNGDVGIKEKLIKLRSLLVKHNASEELENAVRSGNFELAVKISKEFPKNNPAAKIDKLISIANGSMKNVFGIGQIKSNRAARAVTVQDMDISDLNDLGDGQPDETPVLILSKLPKKVNSLLSCFDAEKVKKQIDFPLNVLLHISCIKRIQDHVIASIPNSQFMEIDKIQDEVLDDENFYIPMGGIPLGCDPTHVKMANKTIMDFIAGGKKLGNPDFWFATIYFCLEKADPDKSKYAELMVPQLKYRLRKRFSTLSLSGASNFNLTSLPIDISLWYTLNSIYFESDVFNLHASHIKYLQELYEMTSLMPLDEKVKTAIKVVGAKNYLHKLARTNPLAFESKKNEILYNTVTINLSKMKFEVPIDGVSKYDENSFSMMAKLCQITDRNIACHLIPIPTEIPEIKKEDYQEWKNYKFVPFTIYPKTFRPPVNQCPPFNELKNSNAEVVPWTKIFYKAAKRIKKFPNTNDLAYQTYLEYVKSGKKKTLMPDVLKICSQVEKAYKPAIQGTQVDDFLKIFNMSANREKRMEMENEK
ncbi:hypothetical protein TVAG_319770 [Trichomonas vaginalis G3]|uniref:Uncharacterized protein n=1 Tax=Trichomonas vaginalis (strain ATCC PRA-98 / G3) TaxID=412133 RepID=A2DQC5_TRIV3|nr:hypothetical protein TVAGG3_1009590 [Trichomonas vaginalis G3]EAY17382.1 hypothetical protein TVAG_319770 [Trichomonas vaginalis G3]KAI5491392.1 hypothetical protein TVAGG3_1009590 [Trichomonas vaginalis G3]|eukprot:XP_001330751.1 hypothetical protein [Trichomonas vaginalis G3]